MSSPRRRSSPNSNSIRRANDSCLRSFSSESGSQFAEICYWPSVMVVLTGGLANLVFSCIGGFVGSILALILSTIFFEWIDLHSEKLTRREHPFFDEVNILGTSEAFEFNLSPVIEDTTPGVPGACCGPYPKPQGLIASLFRNEKEEDMQNFYRTNYGGMYTIAKKAQEEQKDGPAGGSTETEKNKPKRS
ncbi:hypothetical protein M3Y98_00572400 [Aphelenchoides besseyi]|nr:hypothetical protein M3Y98_00572400 [Aphelenchoides besseyi]KAI6193738.1 hypothetical protein M3Y96_01050700 [Aphelenchoides besseyi]